MKISFLGSGNVATHLSLAFNNAGHEIVQIWSRNRQHAIELANQVNAEAVDMMHRISTVIDLLIIAVKDDAIQQVVADLQEQTGIRSAKCLLVHTSGVSNLSLLKRYYPHVGILYPLQTFSKARKLSLLEVPICIEGSNTSVTQQLLKIASSISNYAQVVDATQRRVLHVSAVFACNFVNFMYACAASMLEEHHIPFDILRPLILETALKVQDNMPWDMQTGPAIRRDEQSIAAHTKMLDKHAVCQDLYRILTQSIIKMNPMWKGQV